MKNMKTTNKGWFTSKPRPQNKTGITKTCQCGKEFYCEKSKIQRKKYCSIKCRCDFHPLGAKKSDEEKRRIGLMHKGKIISREVREKIRNSHLGKKQTREHVANMKANIPYGKECYNYVQDRSQLKRNEKKHLDSRYREWMLSVKKRDGWKCKISNGNCMGRLESHHILRWSDYPELRYQINNGITLCHAHHPRKREDEAKLSPFFQQLVAEMH